MVMELINKDSILRQIPLFKDLSCENHDLLKEIIEIAEYKKGQVIYEEGSCADAFYCVVFGRVVIYARDSYGNNIILEYLHRGRYFGIISLLTNEPHSVTAKAINDSTLLVIRKFQFDSILKKIPHLAIDLSQTLSRRLKSKNIPQKTIFESKIISVFSSYSRAGKTVYALNLGISLHRETRKSVIILDICPAEFIHSLPQMVDLGKAYKILELLDCSVDTVVSIKEFISKSAFDIDLLCISYKNGEDCSVDRLLAVLSLLMNSYHYIILDLPSAMDRFVFNILNQADIIHVLSSSQTVDLNRTQKLINRLKNEFNFSESKIKVIINEYRLSKISNEQQRQLLNFEIYATLKRIEFGSSKRLILDDPESEYAKAIRRISRQIGDNLTGLALGVGMGYGLCHIGVLKVIEDENIPVDIIAGSSIGAVIASLWAAGRSALEILEITKQEFKEPRYTWGLIDLTFPLLGFIKGDRLYRFLKKYLGNKTFYDINLPLKIIACDIKKKESRIFDNGSLVEAIMASCAMPGVFKPFKFKEDMLLDGGLINPLPTEVLFNLGIKKIIAVNVTPSKVDMLKQFEHLKEEFNSAKKHPLSIFSLKRYLQDKFKNNILDIIFTSIETMQSQIIQKESQFADIVLHPDTSGLHWLQLSKSVEFFERGRLEALKNLDRIRQIVND